MRQRDTNKAYYLDIWTEMLCAFLGWSPSEVMAWAREAIYLDQMDDPHDLYYHETPQYWIRGLLIPAPVREGLSDKGVAMLRSRILAVFADEHHYEFPRGTNWRPFRQRIDDILAEVGGKLPPAGDG